MIEIKTRHVNDLVICPQKTYKLYFVEFRETVGGRENIVLCHHQNKDYWISIIVGTFRSSVFVNIRNNKDKEKQILEEIRTKKYIGSGKKHQYKWLQL